MGKQRYSLKRIRQNYTYSVDEIAELYGLTTDTVFRWIRNDGLKRIPFSRKFFVHGSELIEFLINRNGSNKHPCKEGEIYCCKCGQPQKPITGSLKIKKNPNMTISVKGKCSICDTSVNTFVSGKKWSRKHPFHPDKYAPTKPHRGEYESPRECRTRKGEQLCLNITQ